MSKSKEGMEPRPIEAPQERGPEEPRLRTRNEPERESWPEFPRRSRSMRYRGGEEEHWLSQARGNDPDYASRQRSSERFDDERPGRDESDCGRERYRGRTEWASNEPRYRERRSRYEDPEAGMERRRERAYPPRDYAEREARRRELPEGGSYLDAEGRDTDEWNVRYREGRHQPYARGGWEPERAEYGRSGWASRDYQLRCRELMTKDVTTCSPETIIREVAEKMEEDDDGSIPVVDNGRLVGIVTDRDIVCRVLAENLDTRSTTAATACSEDIVTCTPDEPVIEALHKMAEYQIRRIPIVDAGGRLRGVLTLGDIALEFESHRELADALDKITRSTPNQARRRQYRER